MNSIEILQRCQHFRKHYMRIILQSENNTLHFNFTQRLHKIKLYTDPRHIEQDLVSVSILNNSIGEIQLDELNNIQSKEPSTLQNLELIPDYIYLLLLRDLELRYDSHYVIKYKLEIRNDIIEFLSILSRIQNKIMYYYFCEKDLFNFLNLEHNDDEQSEYYKNLTRFNKDKEHLLKLSHAIECICSKEFSRDHILDTLVQFNIFDPVYCKKLNIDNSNEETLKLIIVTAFSKKGLEGLLESTLLDAAYDYILINQKLDSYEHAYSEMFNTLKLPVSIMSAYNYTHQLMIQYKEYIESYPLLTEYTLLLSNYELLKVRLTQYINDYDVKTTKN